MAQTVPKGRDALYSGSASTVDDQPSTVDGQPSAAARPAAPAPARSPRGRDSRGGETFNRLPSTVNGAGQNWTEAHQRVTFYCHRDLIRDIERAMEESRRSKSQVIVDAIRKDLTP